jgi:hypothetical protein
MAKTKTISFGVWKTLFRDTLTAFSSVWWRIASVNIFTILTLILGTGILIGLGYVAFQSTIENLIANISFGGALAGIIPLIALAIVWTLFILVFSANGKIANNIVLKNYTKKIKRSPFKVYFIDTWHYLWRYILLSLHVLWYLLWPIIIFAGVISLSVTFSKTELAHLDIPTILLLVVMGMLFLWRMMYVVFMKSTLVHFDKKEKSTFKAMRKLVKGNWWGVLLSIVFFFIVANVVRVFFLVPESIFANQEFNIFALLDFLFSFFVLAPLLISFMYLFMLHLSKTKKIKP